MIAYRISKREYSTDLSGMGARLFGGRWNPKGVPMFYAAMSSSLAILEKLVHLSPDHFPDLCLIEVEINSQMHYPEVVAEEITNVSFCARLGVGLTQEHLAVAVPSIVNPFDYNIICSPLHSQFSQSVGVLDVRDFTLDQRLMARFKTSD